MKILFILLFFFKSSVLINKNRCADHTHHNILAVQPGNLKLRTFFLSVKLSHTNLKRVGNNISLVQPGLKNSDPVILMNTFSKTLYCAGSVTTEQRRSLATLWRAFRGPVFSWEQRAVTSNHTVFFFNFSWSCMILTVKHAFNLTGGTYHGAAAVVVHTATPPQHLWGHWSKQACEKNTETESDFFLSFYVSVYKRNF